MRFLSTPENTVLTLRTEAAFAAAGLVPDTGVRLSTVAAVAAVLLVPAWLGGWAVAWRRRRSQLRQARLHGQPSLLTAEEEEEEETV